MLFLVWSRLLLSSTTSFPLRSLRACFPTGDGVMVWYVVWFSISSHVDDLANCILVRYPRPGRSVPHHHCSHVGPAQGCQAIED